MVNPDDYTRVTITVRVEGPQTDAESIHKGAIEREAEAIMRVRAESTDKLGVGSAGIPEMILALRGMARTAERAITRTGETEPPKISGESIALKADTERPTYRDLIDGEDVVHEQEVFVFEPEQDVIVNVREGRATGRVCYDGTIMLKQIMLPAFHAYKPGADVWVDFPNGRAKAIVKDDGELSCNATLAEFDHPRANDEPAPTASTESEKRWPSVREVFSRLDPIVKHRMPDANRLTRMMFTGEMIVAIGELLHEPAPDDVIDEMAREGIDWAMNPQDKPVDTYPIEWRKGDQWARFNGVKRDDGFIEITDPIEVSDKPDDTDTPSKDAVHAVIYRWLGEETGLGLHRCRELSRRIAEEVMGLVGNTLSKRRSAPTERVASASWREREAAIMFEEFDPNQETGPILSNEQIAKRRMGVITDQPGPHFTDKDYKIGDEVRVAGVVTGVPGSAKHLTVTIGDKEKTGHGVRVHIDDVERRVKVTMRMLDLDRPEEAYNIGGTGQSVNVGDINFPPQDEPQGKSWVLRCDQCGTTHPVDPGTTNMTCVCGRHWDFPQPEAELEKMTDRCDELEEHLANVIHSLQSIIAYPRFSHPGQPAVSFEHRSLQTYELAVERMTKARMYLNKEAE